MRQIKRSIAHCCGFIIIPSSSRIAANSISMLMEVQYFSEQCPVKLDPGKFMTRSVSLATRSMLLYKSSRSVFE